MSRRSEILRRVSERIDVDPQTGCWIWRGPTSGSGRGGGYPRMCLDGRTVPVHRVMWVTAHGYLPASKQLDHKCRNRLCVNPAHLEPVTHRENCRRRDAAARAEAEDGVAK
ncbi:MAG: HNH endonuclease signature motif containing protein [Pseudomonadota bacterium]